MREKITIAATLLLLLTGCTTRSSFYQLHPKVRKGSESRVHRSGAVIGIAEIELSEYLDKPEIVTRLSAGRLAVHEQKRWAGSLPKNLQSVLRRDLESMLPRYTLLSYPWEEPVSDSYRIYLIIDRFDGDATGRVTLEGRWSLVDRNESHVLISERIERSLEGGTTLDAIVDTESRLLYRLSRHIAASVRAKI